MSRVSANNSGVCPYCSSSNFDSQLTEARHVSQDKMKCVDCSRWSVRDTTRGIQYPLQDPSDKDSSPTASLPAWWDSTNSKWEPY
jgi:hypothetical protein